MICSGELSLKLDVNAGGVLKVDVDSTGSPLVMQTHLCRVPPATDSTLS